MRLELEPGMIFCTANPMLLGRAICFVQKVWSSDNRAEYSHAGIILDEQGTTFEALWTNRKGTLDAYRGKKVLIGRHERMDLEHFQRGWEGIKKYEGQAYAGWRLFLHLVPPLAKYLATGGFAVCSEIAAKFIDKSEIYPEGFYWKGRNPDNIADMIRLWRDWQIVCEDVW